MWNWVHRHTLNHFSKEICLNGFTMQSYGFPEGLQISLYRWASFRWSSSVRGHYSQSWGSSRISWWRNLSTQEADQIFSTNSSSALFNPSQHILIASLIANLNSNIKTSLLSIPAFFVEFRGGGGCVLEGNPQRQSWLLTHPVFPSPWELLLPLQFPVSLESLLPRSHSPRPLSNGL